MLPHWLRKVRGKLRSEDGAESLQILTLITIGAVCLLVAKLSWSHLAGILRSALDTLTSSW